jgi:transcriptional regulator with XRE-family HTH domain
MDELGARVRGFRHARGLTGSALAHQAGIDAGQLSRIEHGQAKRPGPRPLANLAAALGVCRSRMSERGMGNGPS